MSVYLFLVPLNPRGYVIIKMSIPEMTDSCWSLLIHVTLSEPTFQLVDKGKSGIGPWPLE